MYWADDGHNHFHAARPAANQAREPRTARRLPEHGQDRLLLPRQLRLRLDEAVALQHRQLRLPRRAEQDRADGRLGQAGATSTARRRLPVDRHHGHARTATTTSRSSPTHPYDPAAGSSRPTRPTTGAGRRSGSAGRRLRPLAERQALVAGSGAVRGVRCRLSMTVESPAEEPVRAATASVAQDAKFCANCGLALDGAVDRRRGHPQPA